MTPTSVNISNFVPRLTDLTVVEPETTVAIAGIIILIATILSRRSVSRVAPWIATIALAEVFVPIARTGAVSRTAFGGLMVTDGFAVMVKAVLAITGLIAVAISASYVRREEFEGPEFFALLLFSLSGMMMMASSSDLIMVFLSLEVLSISLYILSGYARAKPRSEEAAMKYFLLGSFASAFLLFGVALVYGSTGTTRLAEIGAAMRNAGVARNPMLLAGMGLITVGLGFKVAAVPFHMWTPDVYEGAPSPVTAFMSVGAKAAGFAALIRVYMTAFGGAAANWIPALWVVAAITMVVGNVVAIAQTNIKRLLAYSSIAQAGYILVAVVAANRTGVSAAVFYLLAYTFMNLGAWAVVILVGRQGEANVELSDYTGLFWRNPALAGAMAVFMVSLTGLPPTGGFMGKFYVFSAALQAKMVGLVIIGVLTSLISAYYYLRITVLMFMHEPKEAQAPVPLPAGLIAAIVVTTVFTVLLGVYPNEVFRLAGLARIAMQ